MLYIIKMGIHDFTKCFKATRTVKIKDFAGSTVAVDALGEIWRAALGAKSVTILTDAAGKPTLHITVILAMLAEFKKHNISQIWVFDHSGRSHNLNKLHEQAARQATRQHAVKQLKQLADFAADNIPVFDIPDITDGHPLDNTLEQQTKQEPTKQDKQEQAKQEQKNSLEKRAFSVSPEMIDDVILILNALNIPWLEAPAGFEAEAICSQLNAAGLVSWVYSGDTDPVAFGALVLVRRNVKDKLYYEYTSADICEQITKVTERPANISDIRKIAVVLGCDFCARTPGVGPATVKKKYTTVTLTPQQTNALKHYSELLSADIIAQATALLTKPGEVLTDLLITWLVEQKNFNRTRLNKTLAAWLKPDDLQQDKTSGKKMPGKTAAVKKTDVKKPAVKKLSKPCTAIKNLNTGDMQKLRTLPAALQALLDEDLD
jgi:5'-3' exonuclease